MENASCGSNHEASLTLLQLSREQGLEVKDERFANCLDSTTKPSLRDQFHVPTISEMLGADANEGMSKGSQISYCILFKNHHFCP